MSDLEYDDLDYDDMKPKLPDPYGNCGMDPEPQWSGVWTSWTEAQRAEYVRSLEHVDSFNKHQIVDILQGFPPRTIGWDSPTTFLVENEGPVQRYWFDVRTGAVPPSFTRDELVVWCLQRGVPLPDLVADAAAQLARDEIAKSKAAVLFPAWAPVPPEAPRGSSTKRSRGRPSTTALRNQEIVQMADDFVMSRARGGLRTTLSEVATHLASTTSYGMTNGTILRTLKGKVQLARANTLADSAAARRGGAGTLEP